MSPQLDELLCARYPAIFRDRHGDERDTCMARGFDIKDGWFVLIDTLCAEIQRHVDHGGARQVVASQVKNKFGRLCYYYQSDSADPDDGGHDEYVDGLMAMAEALSSSLCETCGAPATSGRRGKYGWMDLRCPEHSDASDPRRSDLRTAETGSAQGDPSRTESVFSLPVVRNAGWQHLARELEAMLRMDIRYSHLPPDGGGDRKRAAGAFRLVEAYSLPCDRLSGRVT